MAVGGPAGYAAYRLYKYRKQKIKERKAKERKAKARKKKKATYPSRLVTQKKSARTVQVVSGRKEVRKGEPDKGRRLEGEWRSWRLQFCFLRLARSACMACRLAWAKVEMDVSNARYIQDVENSFKWHCQDMQKSPIFYEPVSGHSIAYLTPN